MLLDNILGWTAITSAGEAAEEDKSLEEINGNQESNKGMGVGGMAS